MYGAIIDTDEAANFVVINFGIPAQDFKSLIRGAILVGKLYFEQSLTNSDRSLDPSLTR
jgi:hypothetical protein